MDPPPAGETSVTIDFPKTKAQLVSIIDKVTGPGRSGSIENQRDVLRNAIGALPGTTASVKEEGGNKKMELVAEAKAVLELAFRTSLDARIRQAATERKPVLGFAVDSLLDASLWCAEEGFVDASLPLLLTQELIESQTIDLAESAFSLLEQRADLIARLCLVQRSPKLKLLGLTIDLLRRLSKSNNTVFSGRILMFLAYVLPLSERSGVNLKSEGNVANVTVYEANPDPKQIEATEGPAVDAGFYRFFWSLQQYFQTPSLLFKPDHFAAFSKAMDATLTAFAANPLAEGGTKVVSDSSSSSAASFFTTKYLTSPRLIKLQLKDPSFRRHILTQCLLLFHSLQLPATKPPSSSTVPPPALKDKPKAAVAEYTKKVKELLDKTPPAGPKFADNLLKILQRENNWVHWKREGCPPFEKATAPPAPPAAPASLKQSSDTPGLKRKRTDAGPAKKPLMGNPELARLWALPGNLEAIADTEKTAPPTLLKFLEPMQLEADPAEMVEEAYKLKNNKVWTWKAMRLIARNGPQYFSKIKNNDLESILPHVFGTPDPKAAQAAATHEQESLMDTKVTEEDKEITSKPEEPEEEVKEEEKAGAAAAAPSEEGAIEEQKEEVAAADPLETGGEEGEASPVVDPMTIADDGGAPKADETEPLAIHVPAPAPRAVSD